MNTKKNPDPSKYVLVKRSTLNKRRTTTNNPQKPKTRQNNKPKAKRRSRTYKPIVLRPSKANPQPGIKSAYMECRLSPFTAKGSNSMIPDGSEMRRLMVDHRMLHTFTFGSSGMFNIAVTPCIPCPIWTNTGTNVDVAWTIDGSTFPDNSGVPDVYVPRCLPEWYDLPITRNNLAGDFNEVGTLYDSTRFRIVSVGWAVTYVGSAMNNGGSIIITSTQYEPSTAQTNNFVMQVYSSRSGTNTNYNNEQLFFREMATDLRFNVLNQESVTTSLSAGAHGILKHIGSDYAYQPISANEQYLCVGQRQGVSVLMNEFATPATLGTAGCVLGYDSNWSTTLLTVFGQPGQSFILDTIYCIEYIPVPGSSTYSIARQGPPHNPAILSKTENLAKKMPIAESGGISNLTNMLSYALSAGKVASALL